MTLLFAGLGAGLGSFAGGFSIAAGIAYGSMVGSVADQIANRPPRSEVGKLSDRRFTDSSYGTGIPLILGKGRVGGSIIWAATDKSGNVLKQHTRKVGGGKKGGGQKIYTYSATLALQLCLGAVWCPDPSHPDGGEFITIKPRLTKLVANDLAVYVSTKSKNRVTPVWHDGSELQEPDPTMVAKMGVPAAQVPAHCGTGYAMLRDFDCEDFGNRIPTFSADVETDPVDLATVFTIRCRMAGILAAEIDASAGIGVMVDGFVSSGRTSAQSDLEPVLLAYGFDVVEVDGVLRLVKLGGVPTFTITAADLGASTGGPVVKLERSRGAAVDLPGRMDVSFFDTSNALQSGNLSVIRQSADIQNSESIQLPLAFSPDAARGIAGRRLDQRWAETENYGLSTAIRFFGIAPGDVGTVAVNGVAQRVRMTAIGLAPIGEIKFTAVLDDASIWTQPIAGGGGGIAQPIAAEVPSVWVAWSGPEIQDADQSSPGFYVAASGGDGWTGCTIFYSLDGGANWIEGGDITGACVFGTATSALSAAGAAMDGFDTVNTVGVDLSASLGTLSNAADSSIMAGNNHAVLGGEILGVGRANLTGANAYTLSRLRRGERGTAMDGHASGDLFVLLTPDVARVSVDASYVGSTVLVKCVSRYQDLTDVTTYRTVTIAPRTLTQQEKILASVVFPRFLRPQIVVVDEVAAYADWRTVDVSAAVPETAQALILEAEMRIGEPDDGDNVDAYVRVRPNASEDSHVLLRGRAAGNADNVATFNRGDYPLDAGASYRRFDIKLDLPSGYVGACSVRVVGYWG